MNALFLIPCKPFGAGKSRLAHVMSAAQRHDLCEQLLIATLRVAAALVAPDRILVVTADAEAAAIGRRLGAGIRDDPFQDLNRSLDAARQGALDDAECRLVVLPIDLPLATPNAVRGCVEREADIVLATDLADAGTNLLALGRRAKGTFPFCFGPGSLAAHRAAAARLGLTVYLSRDPRLTFDLDGPDDLSRSRGADLRSA